MTLNEPSCELFFDFLKNYRKCSQNGFSNSRKQSNHTPHTLKIGFRYQRDFKDFKDMINNKNRILKCGEYSNYLVVCGRFIHGFKN
jgi:hypothetical protein